MYHLANASIHSRNTVTESESPPTEVRATLKRIILTPDVARNKTDYEFLDKYVHSVTYFSDVPPNERIRYLRAVKGIEIDRGEALFNIGDAADSFYCVLYGALNVVLDFAHMSAPTLNDFEEILNRARVHASLLHPGGGDSAYDASLDANYVVRTLKALECFGDVGLLLDDQHRTASVVACERTLLMKIDRDTFLELRSSNIGRELREKVKFLSSVRGFDHWDTDSTLKLCSRMEKVAMSYNDVVVAEGEPTTHFYFVKHGECRLVKRYRLHAPSNELSFVEVCTVGSRHYVGAYEVVSGEPNAVFSALVSSPTAVLYRVDRVDFRQCVLKDAVADALLRAEARELAARLDDASVRQDLAVDAKWDRYRRDLTASVLATSERMHANTCYGPRTPGVDSHIRMVRRPLPAIASRSGNNHSNSGTSSLQHSPRSPLPPSTRSSANVYNRRPSILVTTSLPPPSSGSPRRTGRDKKQWLEWATTRANEIVIDSNGQPIDAQRNDETTKSSIQWSKTSKILGGMSSSSAHADANDGGYRNDKVTSALVSLFSTADGAT